MVSARKKELAKMLKHLPLLKTIKRLNKEQQLSIIPTLDDDSLDSLISTVRSCVRNKLLPEHQKRLIRRKLAGQKEMLLHVSNAGLKKNGQKRKNPPKRSHKTGMLSQLGGFPLATLAAVGIPFLVNTIKDLVTKK